MAEYLFARLDDVDAVSAMAAKVAAEAARDVAEGYRDEAQDAQTAAEVAQGLAEDAQAAAEAAQLAAENAADNFDDVYLGSKATDPTLDNDGNALAEGQLYWSTAINALKVYDGSAWVNYSAQSGILAVVEDTTPQLGGDLDFNGFSGTGASFDATTFEVTTGTAVTAKSTQDSANVFPLRIEGDRANPTANDIIGASFYLSDSAGNQDEFGRFSVRGTDVTSGSEDAVMYFGLRIAGTLSNYMTLSGSALTPFTSDALALGSASLPWSDLFLASGSVVNFNNGDVTITHSANGLSFAGVSSAITYTFDAPITVTSAQPRFILVDSDTSAESRIDANSSGGGLFIQADFNNVAANTVIRFDVDGTALMQLATASFRPVTGVDLSLGDTTQDWGDLFMASGAVMNWDNGDVTLTHAANLLTLAGGNLSIGTSGVFTAGTVELGAAADTTLSRLAAGLLGVEGKAVAFRDATPNIQTGTTYTLALTDANDEVLMNNGSSNVVTIPTNASIAFPVGTEIAIRQIGAGVTTVDGDTGVTVNGVSGGGAAILARYQGVSLVKQASDTWVLSGAHGAVA